MNVYIGELPPPYGGVAVKNSFLLNKVYCNETNMIDLVECKRRPIMIPYIFARVVHNVVFSQNIIIGVGTIFRIKCLLILIWLILGNSGTSKVTIIVMGGMIHTQTEKDSFLLKMLGLCRTVWVQTQEMKNSLERQGLKNTKYCPTCKDISNSIPPQMPEKGIIKLVFFSRICRDKGIETIIEAVRIIKKLDIEFTLDFYGEIEKDIDTVFRRFICQNDNIQYHGVFDGTDSSVYRELNKYDVIILPTRWKGEGIPNALIEAKMAGITAIVSDWKYNSEIVKDKKEGFLLSEPMSESLAERIDYLFHNNDILFRSKKAAFDSRLRYSIDSYKFSLIEDLKE